MILSIIYLFLLTFLRNWIKFSPGDREPYDTVILSLRLNTEETIATKLEGIHQKMYAVIILNF